MKPVPAEMEALEQLFEQLGMSGICAQGAASVVPALVSEPVDFEA
jgi:hypothetical protein